ncbi:5-aminolevulinate synthase [Annulohypoxylon moriforme]|nr:5-aminolevulinate synthase [Annulohypoxylon moriforme]
MSSTESIISPNSPLLIRIRAQKVDSGSSKGLPTFYRNLEEALDIRRSSQSLCPIVENNWQAGSSVDFSSNDILSLNASGTLRTEFLAELSRHPGFSTGSGGSRLIDGNYPYIEKAELEIAEFHGAESGLILGSGFDANVAIWTAIPRPGDVIVYDALVHASTHEGMNQSVAMQKFEFTHNDVESFREVLHSILKTQPLVKQGKRSVIVAVESVYSMEGDVCPLQELVDISKELSDGHGNIQFVVDEAHSTGIIGPKGSGLVCELGLEKEIALIVHTCGKAMGGSGAIILGNKTTKAALANFARSIVFTTAPSFPFVASMRAAYTLLQRGETQQAQGHVQSLVRLFFEAVTSHPFWHETHSRGLLSIPLSKGWENRPFVTHIVTLWTPQRYLYWLHFHLLSSSYCAFPVGPPAVPPGQSRLKITFHASNTEDQVQGLVNAIFEWAQEIMAIDGGNTDKKSSGAAEAVYSWMRAEGLSGFGMPS